MIENQLKIIKEVQVLNDYTQSDLITANTELQARIREKNDLQLKYSDADHEAANLQFKQCTLEEQATKLEKLVTVAPSSHSFM